ncbi:hypothetical protein V5O48_013473, partial [Marasmius crinis-equi]
ITPQEHRDRFAPQIATVKYRRSAARLRGPLYAALGISPLILLTASDLADKDIKRVDLVQHWMHLGNLYPPVVRQIEFSLWKCILRAVDGQMDIVASFAMFIAEASSTLAGKSLGTNDRDFFNTKFGESFNKESAQPVLAAFIEELPTDLQLEGIPDAEGQDGGESPQDAGSSGTCIGSPEQHQHWNTHSNSTFQRR